MNAQIVFPVFALGFWTFIILILIPFVRISAARKGIVATTDFKLGESENVPEKVRLPNRNYMNLLELPILFYVVCILNLIHGNYSQNIIYIAWAYVALRIIHSIIHIASNHILSRLGVFAISNFVLLALWVLTFLLYLN